MRVLIVEDVADEAATFAEMVRSRGHEPTVAATAEDAIRCLSAGSLDAVLLDLYLPGRPGLDLLRALSDRQPSIPVVAMSGLATEEEARQSLRLGAVEFLPKPLTVDRLGLVLDFVELGGLASRVETRMAAADRRRYPRVALSLDVVFGHEDGPRPRETGWTTDVSPFGMRLRGPAGLPQAGDLVRLRFQPADGQPAISVLSLVVRREAGAAAASFVDLTGEDFRRLKALVDRRTGSA
jgi:CheY-like chemotaxis protein